MTKAELERIWEEVKANHARLRGCQFPHEFATEPDPLRPKGPPRWRCSKCNGTLEYIHGGYYNDGLRHGRGDLTTREPDPWQKRGGDRG